MAESILMPILPSGVHVQISAQNQILVLSGNSLQALAQLVEEKLFSCVILFLVPSTRRIYINDRQAPELQVDNPSVAACSFHAKLCFCGPAFREHSHSCVSHSSSVVVSFCPMHIHVLISVLSAPCRKAWQLEHFG